MCCNTQARHLALLSQLCESNSSSQTQIVRTGQADACSRCSVAYVCTSGLKSVLAEPDSASYSRSAEILHPGAPRVFDARQADDVCRGQIWHCSMLMLPFPCGAYLSGSLRKQARTCPVALHHRCRCVPTANTGEVYRPHCDQWMQLLTNKQFDCSKTTRPHSRRVECSARLAVPRQAVPHSIAGARTRTRECVVRVERHSVFQECVSRTVRAFRQRIDVSCEVQLPRLDHTRLTHSRLTPSQRGLDSLAWHHSVVGETFQSE